MHISLEAYAGPMDLLLSLISKNEINIYDIPISDLTRQYLDAIEGLPPDMDGMSEFLVMAATLLEIKSRMLLPRYNESEEEEDEDPREGLVRQLIAYKHWQDLAEILKNTPGAGARITRPPEHPLMSKNFTSSQAVSGCKECGEWLNGITTEDIWKSFVEVMQRRARKVDTVRHNFGRVPREQYTVADKISQIGDYLQKYKLMRLSELFARCESKEECVVTFLALLEMIRQRAAAISQDRVFGEIKIWAG